MRATATLALLLLVPASLRAQEPATLPEIEDPIVSFEDAMERAESADSATVQATLYLWNSQWLLIRSVERSGLLKASMTERARVYHDALIRLLGEEDEAWLSRALDRWRSR